MSSSDSDNVESFFDSLRTNRTQKREHLSSSDGMDDFIVDDNHESYSEDETSENSDSENEREENTSPIEELHSVMENLKISPENSNNSNENKNKSQNEKLTVLNGDKKSTPPPNAKLKKIYDFTPRSSTARRVLKKTVPTPKLVFSSSDSEIENDEFWTRIPKTENKNSAEIWESEIGKENSPEKSSVSTDPPPSSISTKKKSTRILLLSDDSSSDDEPYPDPSNPTGMEFKDEDLSVFDSPIADIAFVISSDESDDSYIPLVARIDRKPGGSVLKDLQNYDSDLSKRKSSEPTTSRKPFLTPAKRPPKSCVSEKPVKSKTRVKKEGDRMPWGPPEFLTPSKPPPKSCVSEKSVKCKPMVTKRSDGMPVGLPPNSDTATGFKKNKGILTKILYAHFNETVFEKKLPEDMIVEWSKRLFKTAGITKCQSRVVTTMENGMKCVQRTRKATISLSEKVLDTLPRLRDTLCHEMCHAAVWLIDNQNESHGPFWKAWARKAMMAHPDMPMIRRCHSYDITYKHSYQCTVCRKIYGRHSKSINVDRQACGICRGKLVLLPPTKSDGTLAKTRKPSKFALFMKEHYKSTSSTIAMTGETPKHGDVMKALSAKYASLSVSK